MTTYCDMTFCATRGCTKACARRLTQETIDYAVERGILLCIGEFSCSKEGDDSDRIIPDTEQPRED